MCAAVCGLVDAVAEHGAAGVRVLSRAQPDHVRVLRIDLDAAQVERTAAIEDRLEVESAILRFPQPAGRGRDPVHVGFFGSTSMSATRPVVSVGPMFRSVRPSNTSVVSLSPAAGVCPDPTDTNNVITPASTARNTRFICDLWGVVRGQDDTNYSEQCSAERSPSPSLMASEQPLIESRGLRSDAVRACRRQRP
jgi:hypothetical protein